MDAFVHIIGLVLLFGVCLLALASLIFGLPGTFLIAGAAAVYAWATGFESVGWGIVGWLLLLAVVGEGVEFLAAGAGGRGARPSWRVGIAALVGAFAGGIAGTPFLFGVGSLLGALAGAFAGAALAAASEGGSLGSAMRTGYGALRGRFLGFVFKSAIAIAMVILLAARVL